MTVVPGQTWLTYVGKLSCSDRLDTVQIKQTHTAMRY